MQQVFKYYNKINQEVIIFRYYPHNKSHESQNKEADEDNKEDDEIRSDTNKVCNRADTKVNSVSKSSQENKNIEKSLKFFLTLNLLNR